jgi:hypothetical protein
MGVWGVKRSRKQVERWHHARTKSQVQSLHDFGEVAGAHARSRVIPLAPRPACSDRARRCSRYVRWYDERAKLRRPPSRRVQEVH